MSTKKLTKSEKSVDKLSMGKRLRGIRSGNSLSLRELAKSLGISFSLLSFYETGKRRVPVDILNTIAQLGTVSLDWLITGQESTLGPTGGGLYKSLWDASPISLWEEDWSQAKKYVDTLRKKGITDFKSYFDNHPEIVGYCRALLKITDVNQATQRLCGAGNKEELTDEPHCICTEESYQSFKQNLIAMAVDHRISECTTTTHTFTGDNLHINIRRTVPADCKDSSKRVFVSMQVDITNLKLAEGQLEQDHHDYGFDP